MSWIAPESVLPSRHKSAQRRRSRGLDRRPNQLAHRPVRTSSHEARCPLTDPPRPPRRCRTRESGRRVNGRCSRSQATGSGSRSASRTRARSPGHHRRRHLPTTSPWTTPWPSPHPAPPAATSKGTRRPTMGPGSQAQSAERTQQPGQSGNRLRFAAKVGHRSGWLS
jgi:hypothetical protein